MVSAYEPKLRFSRAWLPIVFLLALGFLIYSNTLNAPFVFDDIHSIVEEEARRTLDFSLAGWFGTRSLPFFTFDLNYYFNQTNVTGYHLVNIAIHLATSVAMFFFAYLISSLAYHTKIYQIRKLTYSNHLFFAFLVGLVFATHPIQTQAITYIVQRIASLATFFYVLSLLLYLKFRLAQENWQQWLWGTLSLLATFAAMNSKEISATLPIIILMLEVYFFIPTPPKIRFNYLKQATIHLFKRWRLILPWLIMILVIPAYILEVRDLIFSAPVDPTSSAVPPTLQEKVNIGHALSVSAETKEISRSVYFLTQLNVIRTYERLLVLPIRQNLDYDYPLSQTIWDYKTSLSMLLHLSLLFFASWLFIKKKKVASFSIFFFFIALLPESSIIPIIDVIFEHRLYLPMVGFSLLVGSFLHFLLQKFGHKRWKVITGHTIVLFLSFLLIVTYSIATYRRNYVWADEIRLWTDVALKSPYKGRPNNNLGKAYLDRRNFDKAIEHYKKEIELDPSSVSAYNNLGSIYGLKGDYELAMTNISKALELRPDHDSATNNLGNIYLLQNNLSEAETAYTKAIELNPKDAGYQRNLGDVLVKQNKMEEAALAYETAIKLKSDNALWHNKLGAVYGSLGRFEDALQELNTALALDPTMTNAYSNLGKVYMSQSKYKEALQTYTVYLKMQPQDTSALTNVGIAINNLGNPVKAKEVFNEVLKINPDDQSAQKYIEQIDRLKAESDV